MKFMIQGNPVPKGRPRFTKFGHAYTPQKTADFELFVRAEYLKQCGPCIGGPLEIRIRFCMPIPKSTSKKSRAVLSWHTKKPDIDNLVKSILDALNGVAFTDDGQVCAIYAVKVYGDNPCTVVEILEASVKDNAAPEEDETR